MNETHENRVVPRRSPQSWQNVLIGAGLLGAGMLIGSTASRPTDAWGQSGVPPQTQHFMAGDQLSLPVLNDIASTLHQMDGRLGRLESVAQQLQVQRPAAKPLN
jgi:hypothetical protein